MNIRPTEFPKYIEDLSSSFRSAQVLFTAQRLGLFAALGKNALSAQELASQLQLGLRGTQILCDALCALSLLSKKDTRYFNTADGLKYLCPDSEFNLLGIIKHRATLYARWGRLFEVLQSGKPVAAQDIDPKLALSPQDFARSMANVGLAAAKETAAALRLKPGCRVLDIGGGPGIYALEFARTFPDISIAILDTADTLEVAQESIQRAGMQERITLLPGDAFSMPFAENSFDFILLSNVVHSYSPAKNLELIHHCRRVLAPEGRICIKDFILDPQRTSPQEAALFAVNMLVNTEEGNCFTVEEIKQWFAEAGLAFEAVIPLSPPSSLVMGRG